MEDRLGKGVELVLLHEKGRVKRARRIFFDFFLYRKKSFWPSAKYLNAKKKCFSEFIKRKKKFELPDRKNKINIFFAVAHVYPEGWKMAANSWLQSTMLEQNSYVTWGNGIQFCELWDHSFHTQGTSILMNQNVIIPCFSSFDNI